jgi:hypothetical protein
MGERLWCRRPCRNVAEKVMSAGVQGGSDTRIDVHRPQGRPDDRWVQQRS